MSDFRGVPVVLICILFLVDLTSAATALIKLKYLQQELGESVCVRWL